MDVLETSATVDGDKIKEYQAHVRIKFRIER
jgi:flavin-binding protein dodecin